MPQPGSGSDLPAWAPGVSQVADYIPHRTLARVPVALTGADDTYRLTFDTTTRPTGEQAARLLADAVAYVSSRVAPLHATSQSAAGTLCKILCALWIERSWPQDDSSLERARDMEKTFTDMLAGLIASNTQAWADDDQDQTTPDQPVSAYWSFPPADPRWDSPAYW